MPGEILVLLSALFYGAASVAIVRGQGGKSHDNGLLLSVILTAVISGFIWQKFGHVGLERFETADGRWGLLIFALAGLFSIVFGRICLYVSTERLGAVRASILRRLTPVFAVPFAFLILGTVPGVRETTGGAIVLTAVLLFFGPAGRLPSGVLSGYVWAVSSAAFYAMAYCLRSLGMESVPDPAFGTFVGALAGLVWLIARACFRSGFRNSIMWSLAQNGPWQWVAALSLSIGQMLQFFALSSASVPVVAVLGTLEVIFAAALAAILSGDGAQLNAKIILCVGLVLVGTALLVRL
ncbi:EamA family transporter [Sedimentitalea sp. CY04]|uniref:EamA family transporter n=1 Tax=Parasedimentitalea denitrificans TaxID=2211118 RepID=A0ABX0WAI9_9RHOB|nr:DMT family transporter [Sedimentitalea sp. CY04]NIZ61662.1 EamA family transporter [Sedimentitalea sp. CY04]